MLLGTLSAGGLQNLGRACEVLSHIFLDFSDRWFGVFKEDYSLIIVLMFSKANFTLYQSTQNESG